MTSVLDAPPIAWPSLTDLAQLLGSDLSTFSRLHSVKQAARPRVGRQVKIAPPDAVRILEERGLSHRMAEDRIRELVQRRIDSIPVLRDQDLAGRPEPRAQLVPSSTSSHASARLRPATFHRSASRKPQRQPDMRRFEQRDRELGERSVPLERYIYEQR